MLALNASWLVVNLLYYSLVLRNYIERYAMNNIIYLDRMCRGG